jgi:hypothetical protein
MDIAEIKDTIRADKDLQEWAHDLYIEERSKFLYADNGKEFMKLAMEALEDSEKRDAERRKAGKRADEMDDNNYPFPTDPMELEELLKLPPGDDGFKSSTVKSDQT